MSKPHKPIQSPVASPQAVPTGREGLEYQPYAGLPAAPDPFGSGQYAQNLAGAPLWGGNYANDQQMAGGPNPLSGTYAPDLPGAPDYFTGYQGMLPGSPNFKITPAETSLPAAPEPLSAIQTEIPPAPQPLNTYSTRQSEGSGVKLEPFAAQPLPEVRMLDGPSLHSPRWM